MGRLGAAVLSAVLVSGCALVAVGIGVATAPAAGAFTQKVVYVHPGESVTIDGAVSPIAGPGTAYDIFPGFQPSDCSDDGNAAAFCDYYPVRLVDAKGHLLSSDDLQKNLYAIAFTLDWAGDHIDAPPLGSAPVEQLAMTVWNDPPKPTGQTEPCDPSGNVALFYECQLGFPGSPPNGDDSSYYDSGFGFAPPPLDFGLAQPSHNAFGVQVANEEAVATPYKLTISLIETSGNLADLSVDHPVVDLSALPSPAAVAPMPGITVPALAPGTVITLNSADIGADADLDNLRVGGDNLDLNDASNVLRANALKPLSKPGKASPALMLLWLAVLPLALLAFAMFVLRRRQPRFDDRG